MNLATDYGLHRLGWKAFQDLCVALAEERLQRPVQTFLPTSDAGRDGAFLGTWEALSAGESTIQCKFTSKQDLTLSVSMLADEKSKVSRLAKAGLMNDYIILTNHTVTGQSELAIKQAFQKAGAGRCRVFHRDWIVSRIKESARLRMMVPRLYGMADLTELLDARAYQQAQLILSEMGDNLQKLVVTDAHRRSVRAISDHNLVLLLGSPAAGKSTIGASLALGANDIWKCVTLKSTSPEHLERHIDSSTRQFFWIDDAWGSTQYQRERTESWNQVFPLIQGAMRKGSRFLITSRDYIWEAAKRELKLQALPVLNKSQVIINVHNLTLEEKARILYNHIKMGDQKESFRKSVKPLLPDIAKRSDFLPESARRLGNRLFTSSLKLDGSGIADFFARPKDFLEETIQSLSAVSKAAIALIFLNGGVVRSPIPQETLIRPSVSFGVEPGRLREELDALRGSLLNFAEDEDGPYWTYRHPTVSDAFASYVAKSPELIEVYLQGAKPETILREVVCPGMNVFGAHVVVPSSLFALLAERIGNLSALSLTSFLSYRSNKPFSVLMLSLRPDIWKRLEWFSTPLRDDLDVDLLTSLHRHGILTEERRQFFVNTIRTAVIDEADDSFLENTSIADVLTKEELNDILGEVKTKVLEDLGSHVERIKNNWDKDYDPDDHFDAFRESVKRFTKALADVVDEEPILKGVENHIREAVRSMDREPTPSDGVSPPTQQSTSKADVLEEIFRDVDE